MLRERMVASSRGSPGRDIDGDFIQDKVDMARQRPMVDLVRTVVKRLEYLGVQQADEEVEGRVIIRDHGIQSAFRSPSV